MPAKYKTLSVYPDPTARIIVGGNSPACNRAIECWAEVLRKSMPDLEPKEWCFLADVLNGTYLLDSTRTWGPSSLALEAHDAQDLNGTGDRWFGEDGVAGTGQEATDALIAKLQALTWEQMQYVLTAVSFFWDQPDLNLEHEWWTIPFRVRWTKGQEEAAKSD